MSDSDSGFDLDFNFGGGGESALALIGVMVVFGLMYLALQATVWLVRGTISVVSWIVEEVRAEIEASDWWQRRQMEQRRKVALEQMAQAERQARRHLAEAERRAMAKFWQAFDDAQSDDAANDARRES